MPYKEEIIPYLDFIDPIAKKLGAINTVKLVNKNGKRELHGFNTDLIGFRKSIKPFFTPNLNKALIIGTGGASKAVEAALKQFKCVLG